MSNVGIRMSDCEEDQTISDVLYSLANVSDLDIINHIKTKLN